MSAQGGLLAGGLGGGGVSRAEPVLLVSDSPVPKIPPCNHSDSHEDHPFVVISRWY